MIINNVNKHTSSLLKSWKSNKNLYILLALLVLLPLVLYAVFTKTNIDPFASTQKKIDKVRIDPGQITTSPSGPTIHMSAMAIDKNGYSVNNASYQWGMSSTNSIGTVRQEIGNDKLAKFTPSANVGQGDIWVRAINNKGKETGSIRVVVRVPTPSPTPTPTTTPTPTVSPTPTPLASPIEFRLKLSGVTDGNAQGAMATARFVRSNVNLVTPPFALNHIGNGIYSATLGFTGLQLPPGSGYSIIIKGEKHVARKFCADDQTVPCLGNQSLTIPGGTVKKIFNFTGLSLDPGDLPPQDGKADTSDFDVIKTLLSKPCASLTVGDKKTADLDYNGCIDIGDAFLMRKTLETRYDEN